MDPAPQPNWQMSELERRLLEAARHDRIPDALGARMAEGLGVQAAAAAPVAAPLFAKAGLWGFLSIALVAAVAGWYGARSAPHPQQTAQAPRAVSAPEPIPAAVAPAFHAGETAAVDPAGQAPATRVDGAALSTAAPAALGDDAALRAEVALLDRARKALREGASARALHLLDQHARRFAPAKLAPEATALRIEALVQRRSYEQAASMSQQFANTYPTHPLNERVAQLAASSAQPGATRAAADAP